jgi:hypothetical protein
MGKLATESRLNSRDSTISFRAMINFPMLSDIVYNHENDETRSAVQDSPTKPVRRRSRSLPSAPQLYNGERYDRPLSMLALARWCQNRKPAEEGKQAADGQCSGEKSSSWITVKTEDETGNCSSSLTSAISADSLCDGRVYQSLIPSISQVQEAKLVERKPSKRSGSLALLGTAATRKPRHLDEQVTTTSADVVMCAESPIAPSVATISNHPGEKSTAPLDSFESSFWSAHEGTRQLRDYIQNLLRRTWIQGSVKSYDPSDSLFESARGSMSSIRHASSFRNSVGSEVRRRVEEENHESFLPDTASEWSWETHYMQQDDRATVNGDESNNSPTTTEFGTLPVGSSNLGSPASDIHSKNMKLHAGSGKGYHAMASSVDEKSTKSASTVIHYHVEG